MKHIIPYILFFALLTASCAKVVTPVGGPKDTTPPKMVKEQPSNKSVNFSSKQIKITFGKRVLFRDNDDNRYEIPDIGETDNKTKQIINFYL